MGSLVRPHMTRRQLLTALEVERDADLLRVGMVRSSKKRLGLENKIRSRYKLQKGLVLFGINSDGSANALGRAFLED